MSLNKIMNQGKQALSAQQTGLATVSHNISNVNTEGYSRQRVDLTTNDPTNESGYRVGGGVKVGAVSRAASEFVNRRLEEQKSGMGRLEGMSDVLSQLESVMKDDGEQGLSAGVSRFFNDIRTLSTQPESQPLRAAVRESANSLTTRFQSAVNGIEQVRNDIDRRIEGSVTDINMLTKRIGDLNRRIMELETQGGIQANDERDARDLAVQKLSTLLEVQVTPIEHGGLNVSSGRIGVLVNGVDASEFRAVRGGEDGNDATVHIRQVLSNGHIGKDVTERVENGTLGGYLKVRDETIPRLNDTVNTMAYKLAESVNGVHREAYGLNGSKGAEFFAPMTDLNQAANQLRLSDAVLRDPNSIASAYKFGASGDNRALLDMADLQDKKIFDGGTATLIDQASGIVGNLGVELKSIGDNLDTQRGLMDQLNTVREKTSGVSLDEEALNMMQFQKAFDASAKMIQVADNLMETVINLKRF